MFNILRERGTSKYTVNILYVLIYDWRKQQNASHASNSFIYIKQISKLSPHYSIISTVGVNDNISTFMFLS